MMKDEQKTKEQLVEELAELQAKLAEGKLREESLERQSKEAQVILDAAPVMIAYKNKDDHFTRVNAAFANFVGLPAEEILGRTTFDLVEPREVAQRGRDHDLEVIRTGIPVLNQLVQWSGFSSNKTIWALYSKLPFYDSDGTISGTVSFVIDVDDRKKVEDDLIASEKRYRALFENLTAGFVLFEVVQDNNGVPVDLIIIAANKGFETTTGLNTQDVVGKYLTRVLPGIENDAADWIGTYGQVALTGKSREFEQGSEHLGYSYSIVAYQAGPKQCAVTFTDITDRKHIELELIRLERLRAVGELSAGVSHNLNNILTGVILPAQMIKPKINDPELLEEIDVIINSGERARDLARRLHLSVRSIEDDIPEGININEVICEVVHSTRPRWKDETEAKNLIIELVTKLGDDVQYIKGTKSRLFDILNNFIFNAIDAMPEGGRITITTELVKKCVQLVFSDTGTGIDAETVQHIFKPFFTTKKDKGTGLGLSTVYNTVAQWGGEILVESTPGEGTTFTLLLPIWHQETSTQTKDRTNLDDARSGRLLIVDDDIGVRNLISRLLGDSHEVEVRAGALDTLRNFVPGKYDAVLLDLGMGDMAGDKLAHQLLRADPSMAMVLMTGWEMPADDPRKKPFDFFLQKPLNIDAIEDVIEQAIALRDERSKNTGSFFTRTS